LLRELEQKAFVLAAWTVVRAEHAEHRALRDDFGVARAARIKRADVSVIGFLSNAAAASGACD
jgi:hypothetical protein